jgi:hypothetical protein
MVSVPAGVVANLSARSMAVIRYSGVGKARQRGEVPVDGAKPRNSENVVEIETTNVCVSGVILLLSDSLAPS